MANLGTPSGPPGTRCALRQGHAGEHIFVPTPYSDPLLGECSAREVSPRSSGGAPIFAAVRADGSVFDVASTREHAEEIATEANRAMPEKHKPYRAETFYPEAQVSALRQEAAEGHRLMQEECNELEGELSAARQEAETLRKNLDEAVQAASDANEEEASVRRALDSQILDYDALAREAETLRGQLDAAQKAVLRYGQHDHSCQGPVGDCDCGFLDAVRVAAPREPT